MKRILLVEDHASFRQTLALVFDQEPEFEVVAQAGTLAEARQAMDGSRPTSGSWTSPYRTGRASI